MVESIRLATVFLFIALSQVGIAFACDESKVGYWWYCEPVSEEIKAQEKKLLPTPPSHIEMMEMHPDQLSKMQADYLKQAIWKTTPENVLSYYRVLDVTRKKSLAFTSVTNLVLMENPELNAWAQYTKTQPGRKIENRVKTNLVNQYISRQGNNYGLLVFTQQGCRFCETQRNILEHFWQRHGWPIKEVDIDRHVDLKSKFNVTITPLTIIIKKGTTDWMPVAIGEEALTTIENNVYRSLRYLNGETAPDQFLQMHHQDGGVTDPLHSMVSQTMRGQP